MADQSKCLSQKTLWATSESTSSQAAQGGNSPSISQDGLDQSGVEAVLASPSPQRGKGRGNKTKGISGLSSSASSPQSALLSSLGSKWLQKMGWPGSMEYKTTLKERTTPSGRSILALRATASRTSDKGSTGEQCGWMTPTVSDIKNPNPRTLRQGSAALDNVSRQVMALTVWPTPTSLSFNESHAPGNNRSMNKTVELVIGAEISWGTQVLVDSGDGQAGPFVGPVVYDNDDLVDVETPDGFTDCFPREWCHPLVNGWASPKTKDWKAPALKSYRERGGGAKGEDLNAQVRSSNAETERPAGLALNPAMSRWLMAFPSSWDHCSPGWKSWQEGQQALKDWHESSDETEQAGSKPTETPSPSPAQ
jgi:hypothetical protein